MEKAIIVRLEADKKKPIALEDNDYALYQIYMELKEAIDNLARRLK